MKNKKIIVVLSFICLLLICIIPSIMHGYIYPNESEDTANNITTITQMYQGVLPDAKFRFIGYAILGYPLYFISSLIHVNFPIVFSWFHSLMPLFIGITLYWIFNKLIGFTAGLMSLIIPIFVSSSTIYYIYFGNLYSLISITILYPLFFYFVVEWFVIGGKLNLIGLFIMSVLTGIFHVSGLYLPVVTGLMLTTYLVYMLVKRKKIPKSKIIVGVIILIIGCVAIFLVSYAKQQIFDAINNINNPSVILDDKYRELSENYKTPISFGYYIINFVSVSIIMLLGICIFKIKEINRYLNIQSKYYLISLFCFTGVLILVVYCKLSTLPFRQQTDLAIIIALIVTIMSSVLIIINKRFIMLVVIIIIIGIYPQFIPHWFENNSAIKNADKEVIEYMNKLNVEYYDCSPTVSARIYDCYLEAKYKKGSNILIMRNKPMAQGDDVDNIYYDGHGTYSTDGYILEKIIDDGTIIIEVYKLCAE